MLVAASSSGETLDSPVDQLFGRCPFFLLVDTDTMTHRALPNPAVGASGGAGIAAAQFVVRQGAKAVLTGNVGPNAMQVLTAGEVPVYSVGDQTVSAAIAAFLAGQLDSETSPTVRSDFGKGGGRGPGRGNR